MSGKIHPAPPTLDTFWQATQSKHDDGGGSDAERLAAIIKAEARLNIRLPPLLRALYARRNGGYTRYSLAPADPTYKHSEEGWAQLPDRCLHRLDEFTTVGEMSDSCDFGIGPDGVHDSQSWRNLIPGADKLIVIAQHG